VTARACGEQSKVAGTGHVRAGHARVVATCHMTTPPIERRKVLPALLIPPCHTPNPTCYFRPSAPSVALPGTFTRCDCPCKSEFHCASPSMSKVDSHQ
jgi:hypothetical protein